MKEKMIWTGLLLSVVTFVPGCAGVNNTAAEAGQAPAVVGNTVNNAIQPGTNAYRGLPRVRNDQSVRIDSARKRVIIHLIGMNGAGANRRLGQVWNNQRLHITVPVGWTLQGSLPTDSPYRVEIVPFNTTTGTPSPTGNVVGRPAPDTTAYPASMKVQRTGTYAVMLRVPQRRGVVLDTIDVSAGQVPSVSTSSPF